MGVAAAVGTLAFGAVQQNQAYRQYGKGQQDLANHNAFIEELRADDAMARGRVAEDRHRLNTRRIAGATRASFAASGVVVDDPDSTAANVQVDIAKLAEYDIQTIRSNAAMEAWGFRSNAMNIRHGGQYAMVDAKAKGIGSITSTAGSMLVSRYGFGGGKPAAGGGPGE